MKKQSISAFQSAPLTEARGDTSKTIGQLTQIRFNPLPLPKQGETLERFRNDSEMICFNPLPLPKQGETLMSKYYCICRNVSIRSPYRSKGRLKAEKARMLEVKFQSAPLTEARGDPFWPPRPPRYYGFNPLPLPKQGETLALPVQHKSQTVSIRSPYRSKERRYRWSNGVCGQEFQSAPLTEARGDLGAMVTYISDSLFQSAPLTEARGDLGVASPTQIPNRFNPLPLPKQGERLSVHTNPVCTSWFQSAPLTEARGDLDVAVDVTAVVMFQSAPLTEARGDLEE